MKLIKLLLYLIVIVVIFFLYWFLPKYSYISKNPGYCVNLTKNIYYCGNNAGLDKFFNGGK
jgi:predicted membrane chloride channel (bestrophin family)